MNIARYKKGFITVSDYNSKLHFNKIYCPHCGVAKVKLIRKAKQKSFFEFAKDEQHDELCPIANKPIEHDLVKRLITSDSKKDMSKINFLINKNLERSINLLNKVGNSGRLNYEDTLELMPAKKQQLAENRIREYSKQNIYTINAFELSEIDAISLKGKYFVIYGIAGITATKVNESVRLLFKINQDCRFSVFVAPSQLQYLDFDKSIYGKFAIFGRLKIVGKFINIEIRSTRDLVIIE